MRERSLHIIHSIHRRWLVTKMMGMAMTAFAIAFPLATACYLFTGWTWAPLLGATVAAFTIVLLIDRSWRVGNDAIVRFIDKKYPSIEESAGLLLQDPLSLNLLQQLQLAKTEAALQEVELPSFTKLLFRPLLMFCVSLVVCVLVGWWMGALNNKKDLFNGRNAAGGVTILPGISDVAVDVIAPSYTRIPLRTQHTMNLEVPEGSMVKWKLRLRQPARTVKFIYNDSLTVTLKGDTGKMLWETGQVMLHPGFYQVVMDSVVSELYRIEVRNDQPPVIMIQSPQPSATIEYGEPEQVAVKAAVSDDYGIKDALLYATVAKGGGEAVKFTSQKISFGVAFSAQQKQYTLQKTIALKGLGMEPGDELYFYLSATDNHDQEKRSDIYIVTLADTAKLMSLDGLLNGVNVKPDYFRSQRQIIIETEQLLRDKDTALLQNFNNRSNNLGVDQKLLRLRYGKFLGEEATSNEDVPDHDLGDPANFGNAAVILDAFTDHHDNAEDATFLDADTKKQLKAVLTEMWNAELQLRLFKPREALPFEYKALRLLKDLQQKSRAYVAKTSIKTAPIKLEKRLTGKLDKITEPNTKTIIGKKIDPSEELRDALRVLERMKNSRTVDVISLQALRLAAMQLSARAVKEPGLYLAAFESMKKIIAGAQSQDGFSLTDILLTQSALQRMATKPDEKPSCKTGSPVNALQDAYFRNLQKTGNL